MQQVVLKDGTNLDIDAQSWRRVADAFEFYNVLTAGTRTREEVVATVPVENVVTIRLTD